MLMTLLVVDRAYLRRVSFPLTRPAWPFSTRNPYPAAHPETNTLLDVGVESAARDITLSSARCPGCGIALRVSSIFVQRNLQLANLDSSVLDSLSTEIGFPPPQTRGVCLTFANSRVV